MSPNAEDFNKDELDAPEWLNAEFFTKVLNDCEHDNAIEVQGLKITPGTAKGDHYASVMFRAVVEYRLHGQQKTKSLIIKTMPESDGHKREMLQQSYIFETEIGMYTEVIPKFEAMLQAVGDETIFGPPLVYHCLSPKKVIIFEDIVPHGYTVIRDREPDMTEVRAAYLKLAKWHAVSQKIIDEEPHYFDNYRHSFMTMPHIEKNEFMTDGVELFNELLQTEPELHKYQPHYEAIHQNIFRNSQNAYREYRDCPNPLAMYVLCHGDFHCKNMMFKYDEQQKLLDVLLLDYQLSYVGPMVNDLIYSIYMLMDAGMRANHIDELLYYYFTNFVDTLKKIGYTGEMPNIIDFRSQMLQHRSLALFLLVTFLPMWYDFRNNKGDPEEMITSTDYRRKLYKSKFYIAELKNILPRYLHLGYFEAV